MNMNTALAGVLRHILTAVGITAVTVTDNMLMQVAGAMIALVSVGLSLFDKRQSAVIAKAAALPDVAAVVTTPEIAAQQGPKVIEIAVPQPPKVIADILSNVIGGAIGGAFKR